MPISVVVNAILSLEDNYIWAVHHLPYKKCVVIDPGEALPVLAYLKQHQAELAAILITHHHRDHTGGIADLKKHFPQVNVYGFMSGDFSFSVIPIREGDSLALLEEEFCFTIYEMPGHTLDHVAYYINEKVSVPMLFTGDTLFSGGCGRLFEGTFQQLYDALLTLRRLPKVTHLYCGHEYTINNLRFAYWLEPDNHDIHSRLQWAKHQIKHGPTLPSTLEIECLINPFLRCDNPFFLNKMRKRFNLSNDLTPFALFTYLRQLKDHWKK